jgi:hypothetical protein
MAEELVGMIVEGAAEGIAHVVLDLAVDASAEVAARTQESEQRKQEVRDWVKAILICGVLFVVTILLIFEFAK